MLAVRQFQLKVEKEEDHGVDGQEQESGQVSRVPLPSRKADDLLPSAVKRRNSEEDPRQTNHVKEDDSAAPASEEGGRRSDFALPGEQTLDGKSDAMDPAPDDESPVRSVPQTSKQHGEHQVDVGADISETIAAERDVKIVAQPGAQTDVPSSPEILKTFGEIRLAEVNHEVEAEKLSAAPGNTAVAAEITIDLPGEGIRSEQHRHGVCSTKTAGKDGVGDETAVVSYNDFAKKPFQNKDQTVEGLGGVPHARLLHLRKQMRRPLNWSCNQVWEKADEESIIHQRFRRLHFAMINIHDIGYFLECVKGDTRRQKDTPHTDGYLLQSEQRCEVGHGIHKEIEILEYAEE